MNQADKITGNYKYGKPIVVLISHEEYEKFNQLERYVLGNASKKCSKSGFLSEEESKDFLNKILNIFLIGKRNDGEVYKLFKRKIK